MASVREFDELFAQYETEQDPEKKASILEKMRANVFERNDNNDIFTTLHTNIIIHIPKSGSSELIEISHNLEEIKKRKQQEILNDKAKKEQTSKNSYTQEHPYPSFK